MIFKRFIELYLFCFFSVRKQHLYVTYLFIFMWHNFEIFFWESTITKWTLKNWRLERESTSSWSYEILLNISPSKICKHFGSMQGRVKPNTATHIIVLSYLLKLWHATWTTSTASCFGRLVFTHFFEDYDFYVHRLAVWIKPLSWFQYSAVT